jgi:hypothetical protein
MASLLEPSKHRQQQILGPASQDEIQPATSRYCTNRSVSGCKSVFSIHWNLSTISDPGELRNTSRSPTNTSFPWARVIATLARRFPEEEWNSLPTLRFRESTRSQIITSASAPWKAWTVPTRTRWLSLSMRAKSFNLRFIRETWPRYGEMTPIWICESSERYFRTNPTTDVGCSSVPPGALGRLLHFASVAGQDAHKYCRLAREWRKVLRSCS